jgi:ABC-type uncharacterized transport system substrate-binding protein
MKTIRRQRPNSTSSKWVRGLGWTDGNLRMDVRWAAGNVDQARMFANELIDLQPDVILAQTTPVTAALQRATRTIPIVFVTVSDPVGAGFVSSLPRPGGDITGFINNEPTMAGKWLELLTMMAPGIRRAAAMFNPETARPPSPLTMLLSRHTRRRDFTAGLGGAAGGAGARGADSARRGC